VTLGEGIAQAAGYVCATIVLLYLLQRYG